jgi:hypothetical protein
MAVPVRISNFGRTTARARETLLSGRIQAEAMDGLTLSPASRA